MVKCPKCHYKRTSKDSHIHHGLCPKCGIAYEKWQNSTLNSSQKTINNSNKNTKEKVSIRYQVSLYIKIKNACLFIPEYTPTTIYWSRFALLVIFTLWGSYFIFSGIDWEVLGSSFMHNINLPFHEFGHVFFIPFGHFMSILGGSLFQILWPLFLMMVFIFKYQNPFAGSIMFWWCGQSFIDLSVYIADAPYRALPLISGLGEEAHDWGNILTMTNSLAYAKTFASISFYLGGIIIIVAVGWGAYLLKEQRKTLIEG